MAAIDLLDLEQAALAWTPTSWQRGALSRRIPRFSFSCCTTASTPAGSTRLRDRTGHSEPRSIAGRAIPGSTRVVSFVARSLDRVRGLDRFLKLADVLLRSIPDVLCVVVGDPIVRRGLDVVFHNRDYCRAPARARIHRLIPAGSGFWDRRLRRWWPKFSPRATCTWPRAGLIPWRDRCSRRWPPVASCWLPTPSRIARS